MVRTTEADDRTEVDHAHVSLFTEPGEWGQTFVTPTSDDVSVFDLGELVTDRIESNSAETFEDLAPEPGEKTPLGVVYWDSRGIPTRLVRDDDVVYFTPNGGFDRTE
jgi:hypothetical protein